MELEGSLKPGIPGGGGKKPGGGLKTGMPGGGGGMLMVLDDEETSKESISHKFLLCTSVIADAVPPLNSASHTQLGSRQMTHRPTFKVSAANTGVVYKCSGARVLSINAS